MSTLKASRIVWSLVALASLAAACGSSSDDTGGTGGAGTGGAATGGSATGGAATGGAATGGKATGGEPATGGRATGGAATGGAATGGAATGGAASGGSAGGAMGGTKTGGAGGKGGGVGPATGGATPVGGSSGSGDAVKSAGCGATTWPTTKNNLTLTVGGQSRSYNLRIPDNYDTNHPYRLILAFHWLNGTAAAVTNGDGGTTAKPFYGLVELANNSTIFVAPQGINNGWSDTGHTQTAGGNDIKFTQALVEELENKLCVDKSRIFAEGFSMGGSMSYAVACAMGDVVRAVAVHSGGPMSGCVTHNKPVAYFMTHGTQDAVCTYPDYGVPQVNDFAKVNGCMARDMPSAPSDGGKTANCVDFMGCSAGHPTRACIFQGPHNPTPPVTGGRASSTSWVPGEVWKFFTQF